MKIVWRRRALADLRRIHEYISQHSPKAASRIEARIRDRLEKQIDTPRAAPMSGVGSTRKLVITGTPYLPIYSEEPRRLIVHAIFHGKQNR